MGGQCPLLTMTPPNVIISLDPVELLLRSRVTLGKCLHLFELKGGDEGVCLAELLGPPFAAVTDYQLSHPGSCPRTVEVGLKRKDTLWGWPRWVLFQHRRQTTEGTACWHGCTLFSSPTPLEVAASL